MRSLLSLLAFASCLSGCVKREPSPPERPSPGPPAPAIAPPSVPREEPRVTLVHVDGRGTLEILDLAVTLVVTPHEVIVQRGATPTLVPSQILGRFDPTTARDHVIPALTERLVEVLAGEESRANRWPKVALLVIDADVTMGTLVDVLASSGHGGLAAYDLVVGTDDGPRVLSVIPPRRCDAYGVTPDPCVRPQILFAEDGMLLSAERIDEGQECPLAPHDPAAPWAGRNLVGPDGACPTAWDRDATAIAWLLDELPALGRTCRHALVSAELGVPWSRLAPAFARLHAELEQGLVIEASAPTGCIEPFVFGG